MDIVLARIIKFLNGALQKDDEYAFAQFIIVNYVNILEKNLDEIVELSGISKESIVKFINKLGYKDYDTFQHALYSSDEGRQDQIRARMLDVDSKEFAHMMHKDISDEEMLEYISEICATIDQAKRVILVGALYPISIAVEFQTDLTLFGKPVLQFHHFDKDYIFDENDLVIFISATGRAMNGFVAAMEHRNIKATKKLLITQNPIYLQEEHKVSDFTLHMPGKFDGIFFNYQLMTIFDLIRIHYYQQYYL